MTGEDIISHFQWLVDDDGVDSTQELVLLNLAYDALNIVRPWLFLLTSETIGAIAAGTTSYTHAADMLETRRVILRESATSTNYVVCDPVRFEDRLAYANNPLKYYIDAKNGKIVLCGDPANYAGWLLIHDYFYAPAQLALGSTPVYKRGHVLILAYEMAKQYYFNDQGEKSRSWNTEMENEYNRLFKNMMDWDNRFWGAQVGMAQATSAFPELA